MVGGSISLSELGGHSLSSLRKKKRGVFPIGENLKVLGHAFNTQSGKLQG